MPYHQAEALQAFEQLPHCRHYGRIEEVDADVGTLIRLLHRNHLEGLCRDILDWQNRALDQHQANPMGYAVVE